MKKVLLALLSVLMIFSLAGCGGGGSNEPAGNNSSSNTAWYEQTSKNEEEFELADSYSFSGYTLKFDGNNVTVSIYAKNNPAADEKGYIKKTTTFTKDKNMLSFELNGFEYKFRLVETALICISNDVYATTDIANAKNPFIATTFKGYDFSSLTEPTIISDSDSRKYLYNNGYLFYQFAFSSNEGSLNSASVDNYKTKFANSFFGRWADSYLESCTERRHSYDEYKKIYADELDFCLKMADYILVNKDSDLVCAKSYYNIANTDSSTLGCSLAKYLENAGALYWTMGNFGAAKEAFKSIPDLDSYLMGKYSREVTVNEFNMIVKDPANSAAAGYKIDENGFITVNGKENYRYDDAGRLAYKWVNKDTAYKYTYNGNGTYDVDLVMMDRYGKPLHDHYVNKVDDNEKQETISSAERTTDYPSWLSEIPCGIGKK